MQKKYDDTNRGHLHREDDKRNPKAPDYSGSLNVEGVDYRIAGWVKESTKTGKRFVSLVVEKRGENTRNGARPAASTKHDFDDDLNF